MRPRSPAKPRSIRLTATFKAPPAAVFSALTDPKKIARWTGGRGRVASKVGGRMEMFDGWVTGKVLAFTPGKKLSYTWRPAEWPEEWADSVVTYVLTPAKSGTKVTLEHSHLRNDTEARNHRSGWRQYVFGPLRAFLAEQEQLAGARFREAIELIGAEVRRKGIPRKTVERAIRAARRR
ncbi:MAG: SRPBCC domain-containing protein [Armatimonadetes bacterium]|nr:SRPBCC domain-containing protein [Armatimonadota bacterium]